MFLIAGSQVVRFLSHGLVCIRRQERPTTVRIWNINCQLPLEVLKGVLQRVVGRPKLVEQRIAAGIPYLAVAALGKPVGSHFVAPAAAVVVVEHSTVDTERIRKFE